MIALFDKQTEILLFLKFLLSTAPFKLNNTIKVVTDGKIQI